MASKALQSERQVVAGVVLGKVQGKEKFLAALLERLLGKSDMIVCYHDVSNEAIDSDHAVIVKYCKDNGKVYATSSDLFEDEAFFNLILVIQKKGLGLGILGDLKISEGLPVVIAVYV